MELRWFGSTNRKVAVIGQGTWNIEETDRALAVATLHAAENAGAGDLRLSKTELSQIDQALPRGPHSHELPML